MVGNSSVSLRRRTQDLGSLTLLGAHRSAGQGSQAKCRECTKAKGPGKTKDEHVHMDACGRMDESQEHVKEPDTKDYILCDSIYMNV